MLCLSLPGLSSLFAAAFMPAAALAGDNAQPASDGALPGVAGGYRIVRPAPVPEPEEPAATGHFRVGDVEVRVSGSLTVDIGAGSIRPPAHWPWKPMPLERRAERPPPFQSPERAAP